MSTLKTITKSNGSLGKASTGVVVISATLLCTTANVAFAAKKTPCDCKNACYQQHALLSLQPEVGVDLGFTRTQFKDGQGDKLLNRNQFPINVFFGLNFTEHLGVELGYGETRRKHKMVTLGPGEFAPAGDIVPVNGYQNYATSLSISQPYVSLKYKHLLWKNLEIFTAIGLMPMRINASWENTGDETGTPPIFPQVMDPRTKNVNIRKTIPLIKLGISYPLINSFSLRMGAMWLQTSKIKTSVTTISPLYYSLDLENKNMCQYFVGLTYTI